MIDPDTVLSVGAMFLFIMCCPLETTLFDISNILPRKTMKDTACLHSYDLLNVTFGRIEYFVRRSFRSRITSSANRIFGWVREHHIGSATGFERSKRSTFKNQRVFSKFAITVQTYRENVNETEHNEPRVNRFNVFVYANIIPYVGLTLTDIHKTTKVKRKSRSRSNGLKITNRYVRQL